MPGALGMQRGVQWGDLLRNPPKRPVQPLSWTRRFPDARAIAAVRMPGWAWPPASSLCLTLPRLDPGTRLWLLLGGLDGDRADVWGVGPCGPAGCSLGRGLQQGCRLRPALGCQPSPELQRELTRKARREGREGSSADKMLLDRYSVETDATGCRCNEIHKYRDLLK